MEIWKFFHVLQFDIALMYSPHITKALKLVYRLELKFWLLPGYIFNKSFETVVLNELLKRETNLKGSRFYNRGKSPFQSDVNIISHLCLDKLLQPVIGGTTKHREIYRMYSLWWRIVYFNRTSNVLYIINVGSGDFRKYGIDTLYHKGKQFLCT